MKIHADCANLFVIERLADDDRIEGFTTNPALMHESSVRDYRSFARKVLALAGDKPVSFEVVGDDLDTVFAQATTISGWGDNVYAKVPVTLTDGTPTYEIVKDLSARGVRVNVTAVMTVKQIMPFVESFGNPKAPCIVSVFAGRLADIGWNPIPTVADIRLALPVHVDVLWASARQVYNVVEAHKAGADIITLTPPLIEKLWLLNGAISPADYSLETVRGFRIAAIAARLAL